MPRAPGVDVDRAGTVGGVELILVRHGQPEWTRDGRNVNDPVLTERGQRQAEACARRLAASDQDPGRDGIDRLMVSPARRADETAAPIAAALDLSAEVEPWLLEYQLPDSWEGQPVDVARAAFAAQRSSTREEWWKGLPGSESIRSFHERVIDGVTMALGEVGMRSLGDGLWHVDEASDSQRWVAVAHGGTNSTLVSYLLGCDPEPWEWERFNLGHAALAVLSTTPMAGEAIWSLRLLGDQTHLDLDDRTV